jgi:GNAT superfamily N-acetyltransferase
VAAAESIGSEAMADGGYRRDLGNGLVLRWSTPEDVERVVELAAQVFRPSPEAPLNQHTPIWTRDMFSGRHPFIGPRDFGVVEDTASGKLVASACLLGNTCMYEGIPVGFGRPEEVATLPEYRNQGLIRAIFELFHARSAARGDLMQGITGIRYFYRQFGYEYAASLEDELTVYFPAIPALKPGTPEPYTLREATPGDIPLLRQRWARAHVGAALWTEIGEDYWRWAMAGMHPDALERWRVYLIVEGDDPAGTRRVGALILHPGRWGAAVSVSALMVEAGEPLVRVVPSVLRGVRALAETTRPIRPETPAPGAISFRWSDPALRGALGDTPVVATPYPYAWYLRVADLPRFLRHVAPALERRLAESAQAGYTGEVTVDFYRGGLRLAFEHGALALAEDWRRPLWGEAQAGFPPLVFLQTLFGHRSLDELRRIYPDVWASGDAAALLDTLFPKRPSLLMPLD